MHQAYACAACLAPILPASALGANEEVKECRHHRRADAARVVGENTVGTLASSLAVALHGKEGLRTKSISCHNTKSVLCQRSMQARSDKHASPYIKKPSHASSHLCLVRISANAALVPDIVATLGVGDARAAQRAAQRCPLPCRTETAAARGTFAGCHVC